MTYFLKQLLGIPILIWQFPLSFWGGFQSREIFQSVERYCMFIGYPKSGHSLIGSLLDAHPNIVISHELGALKYLYTGFRKRQLFHLILRNSTRFTESGRSWGGYSYRIPDQWQGRFKRLQVVGDKHGEGASLRLRANPWLMARLHRILEVNVKFIHVVRNPYDSISTQSKKGKLGLKENIDYYFSLCESVSHIKRRLEKRDLFEIKHELFIEDPADHLRDLCMFLGLDAPESYLKACARIIFQTPKKTRYDVIWRKSRISMVEKRMASFKFLAGYSFSD